MNVFGIFTLFAFVYILIWGLIYMLGARKRSWIMAVVRLGITLVSTIISIIVSKKLALVVVELLGSSLFSGSEGISDLFEKVPAGAAGLELIVSLLLAPILFIIVFLVIRWLISMVMWIVEKCVPVLKERSELYLTMPLGALNGILIGMLTLVPLCGYIAFGAELLYTVDETDMLETKLGRELLSDLDMEEDELTDLADELSGQPLVKIVHGTVGKPVFKGLTTARLKSAVLRDVSVKINLEKEFCGLLGLVGDVADVLDSFEKEDYAERDKEAMDRLADSMFESEWVALIMNDTLVAMSESWLDNESFMGLDRPSLDQALNPTINCVLGILIEEEPDTLEKDVRIILDVMGDLMINNILLDNMDYNTLVQRLGKDDLLTDLLAKLDASPRLHALSVELKSLSIRLVTNMLGTELLENGEYDDMIEDVADSLTDVLDLPAKERDAVLIESIQTNFKKEGYDVPENVALEMSNKMLDELGTDGVITSDELKEYMLNHADEGFEIADDVAPDEMPNKWS